MKIFPVRLKIVLLVAGAVTASLLSYLYVGTSLVAEDKVSYVYDYNLAQVRTVASELEKRFDAFRQMGVIKPRLKNEEITRYYQYFIQTEGIPAIAELEFNEGKYRPVFNMGTRSEFLLSEISRSVWNPQSFIQEGFMVTSLSPGQLVVGMRSTKDGNRVFAALIPLQEGAFRHLPKEVQLQLMDGEGRTLFLGEGPVPRELAVSHGLRLVQSVKDHPLGSGVMDIRSDGNEFIASYQKVRLNRLTMVGYIPKAVAFAAADALVKRSVVLGLSIILLTVGLTLIFASGMTRKLREMWEATRKVAQGDYSVRVDEGRNRGKDEVTALAQSFNVMAGKISDLIVETAEKARMEKELETAQLVQQRFFPPSVFKEERFGLSGNYIPASECAGDWWHYFCVGSRMVVVVGDVTGHGVSAALVTAAAHGAFSVLMDTSIKSGVLPQTEEILKNLNTAVYAAAKGAATMTFFVSVLDLDTGRMEMINASHRPAYVYRPETWRHLKPLAMVQAHALGTSPETEAEVKDFQLEAGDMLIWFTDGLLECESPTGEVVNSKRFSEMFSGIIKEQGEDPEKALDEVITQMTNFWGGTLSGLADDVTLVVGAVPRSVQWGRKAA